VHAMHGMHILMGCMPDASGLCVGHAPSAVRLCRPLHLWRMIMRDVGRAWRRLRAWRMRLCLMLSSPSCELRSTVSLTSGVACAVRLPTS